MDLPSETESDIRATYKRTNPLIRNALRRDTGLQLGSTKGAIDDRAHGVVRVAFSPGFPIGMDAKGNNERSKLPPKPNLLLNLLQYRLVLSQTVKGIKAMCDIRSAREPEMNKLVKGKVEEYWLKAVGAAAEEILEKLDKPELANWLYGQRKRQDKISDDIFGTYAFIIRAEVYGRLQDIYSVDDLQVVNWAEISIYWGAIALFAPLFECSPEDFSIVVVTHELAHAFTQIGADIEGERWPSRSFSRADVRVKEGLAQYYTHLVLERLSDAHHGQFGRAFEAFKKLQTFQPQEYKVHTELIPKEAQESDRIFGRSDRDQEAVRSAMLQFRRNRCTTWDQLVEYFKKERERLKANPFS